ncbi:MAG: hypothetical protein JWM68_105 [Verrucomicrobiales bacterium]|nr:hypothetical protein [Verrucomicrobiales bacterium]
MNIQMAVLCDAATDYSGKLNILGTFDTIFSGQFPAVHPQCSIALRVVFNKMEEGKHQLKINFVDEDGKSIMPPIDAPIDVVVPGDATFISRNLVINIQGLKFEVPSLYSIDLALDGRHEASIPLAVKQMAPQQQNFGK